MADKDDWRLDGAYAEPTKGKPLKYGPYKPADERNDHDHCIFCWAKFMNYNYKDCLHEGYCTPDHYYWICEECFNDFKEMFDWTVIDANAPE